MPKTIRLTGQIPDSMAGHRLDQALAGLFPDYSRSRLQRWIQAGQVWVDMEIRRARDRVSGGESVEIDAPSSTGARCLAEPMTLDVLYRDDDLLIINKPPGLVVHPAPGNPDGTLQNGLLHLDPALEHVPRSGLVHRLDKDTSGLLVVARNLQAHKSLVEQLQARTVTREYLAVVCGIVTAGGSVRAPVGRHPVDRKRMAVVSGGKPAVTHYRVAERYRAHTLLRLRLETGRTHQIRVHMAHLRHPLVGDAVYGGRARLPAAAGPRLREAIQAFSRQALHAARLALVHPRTHEEMQWVAPPPADMAYLIEVLREESDERQR
jgi:23S rRNA pseudouridine1911/1915/1917 synthase